MPPNGITKPSCAATASAIGASPAHTILAPSQVIQDQVAARRRRRMPAQHQYAPQAEPGRGGGREPGVVRLRRTSGDKRRRAGLERLRAGVLKLAYLVAAAAAAEAGQVVPLDPELIQRQCRGEPRRRLERRRPRAQ
nr:hypothetical protein GCM10020092_025050 [Actinoplanes digitatis]